MMRRKKIKALVIGLPLACIGLFFVISGVGWLRERYENPRILERNQQRAAELRSRVERFSGSMPLDEFLKVYPEARFNPESQCYRIVIPTSFLKDSPELYDMCRYVEFGLRDGIITRITERTSGATICIWVIKDPLYYFFRAWGEPEDEGGCGKS